MAFLKPVVSRPWGLFTLGGMISKMRLIRLWFGSQLPWELRVWYAGSLLSTDAFRICYTSFKVLNKRECLPSTHYTRPWVGT